MSDAIDRVHYVSQLFGITLIMNSKRKAFLLNKYQTALNAAITASNYTALNSPEKLFSAINAIDPCPKGKYTDWLLRRFIKNEILLSDAPESSLHEQNSELIQALNAFHQHKQFLPIKDINQLTSTKSLIELTTSDSGSELPVSNRVKRRKYKKYLLENGDIECLHKSKICTLFKINTEEGAIFLGRGTCWCTAGKEHNSFDQYHNDGPLYVLIDNKGDKYQLHFPTHSFCDANDFQIDPVVASYSFDSVRRDLEESLPDFAFKNFISSEKLTTQHCSKFLEHNEDKIKYIPEDMLTVDFFQEVIPTNGRLLKHAPKTMVTKALCYDAINSQETALEFIPKKFIDAELCYQAVKQNGYNLEYVPNHLINNDLCLLAVSENTLCLQVVAKEFIDYQLCWKSVKKGAHCLQYVPKHLIDKKLCKAAIENCGGTLQFIPQNFIDYELCIEAVKSYGGAIRDIPEEILDYKICLLAVREKGIWLEHVPERFLSYELCYESIQPMFSGFNFIPEKFKTNELIAKALMTHPDLVKKFLPNS